MTGRTVPSSSYPTVCRTRPSRAVKPRRSRQRCQRTSQPRTSKLGPSGWTISMGLRSSLAGGVEAGGPRDLVGVQGIERMTGLRRGMAADGTGLM